MTQVTLPEYSNMVSTLRADSLAVTPAEMHGLLAGMLCGGLDPELGNWMPMLYDYTNDGAGWPHESKTLAATSIGLASQQLTGGQMDFEVLLPDESESLLDRGDALSEWVSAFIAGIGLVGITAGKLSDDSKEVLADLTEIAQLGIDEDDDMEEQALLFEQVIEHVRVCAMTLHAELGIKPRTEEKPTLH
ncbi:YecA/YgfB family protein [Grimontia sp. NTOU-MAR1]|uniref:YecA/YgfB family protein n=1 Tax=Grimontia sp. NTOU-MAR1 TaxID=3111011 RepID=UPI002DBB6131|nr:YecA family protein [Grimontia sp. NTOU-MAR1]WRV97194.1 YecA family protein [Grimontia sp. NTOU-MAR1]